MSASQSPTQSSNACIQFTTPERGPIKNYLDYNACVVCGVNLGSANPRQLCGKTECVGLCIRCNAFGCNGTCEKGTMATPEQEEVACTLHALFMRSSFS